MNCKNCGKEVKPKYVVHDEKWVLFGVTIYSRKEVYDFNEEKP